MIYTPLVLSTHPHAGKSLELVTGVGWSKGTGHCQTATVVVRVHSHSRETLDLHNSLSVACNHADANPTCNIFKVYARVRHLRQKIQLKVLLNNWPKCLPCLWQVVGLCRNQGKFLSLKKILVVAASDRMALIGGGTAWKAPISHQY